MSDRSGAIRRGHPIVFGLFVFISLIVAIIATAVASKYGAGGAPTSKIRTTVRFLAFVGWWSVILFAVLGALFIKSAGGVITSIAGHVAIIGLTWLFYLAGSAALTDALGGGTNCGLYRGLRYCTSLKALVAFGWIGTVLLTVMLGVVALVGAGAFRGGRSVKESLA